MNSSNLFSKIFGINRYKFNEIHIDQEIIESIQFYAKSLDPNEFMAILDGEVKDEILHVTGLVFLPSESSGEGVIVNTGMLPVMTTQ